MEDLVTVVIPAYNRENTILRAINSVLGQSYKNIEVLVIDDCSKDHTKAVVDDITDPRVRYYKLDKNSGACVARNKGVELAKGEIIAFQDSDDFWHKDKLSKQVTYLKSHGLDFVTCGFNRIDEHGNSVQLGMHDCADNKIENWCSLLNHNWVSTQTIVCYRRCFDNIKFNRNVKRYQDWDLALQAATKFNIGSLNECLVDVYIQSDSITRVVNGGEAKKNVISLHEKDIIPGNKLMESQYNKSMADVLRKDHSRLARKYYWKSLMNQFSFKKCVCWLACFTPFFKHYQVRQ